MGVIPITSRWGAIDNIKHYGYLLPELSVEAIGKGVEWASMLPQDKFHKLIRENIYYSTQTWNLEHFENEFRSTLKETIKTKERKEQIESDICHITTREDTLIHLLTHRQGIVSYKIRIIV